MPPDLPQHTSDSNEWYTPRATVMGAWGTMGRIDLDPASCEIANKVVQAETYYTIEDDGLVPAWTGTVFLNPPYGYLKTRPSWSTVPRSFGGYSQKAIWMEKLVLELSCGNTEQAVVVTTSSTGDGWFHDLVKCSHLRAMCFPRRIQFWSPQGKTVSQPGSSAIMYFTGNTQATPWPFVRSFAGQGWIVTDWVR